MACISSNYNISSRDFNDSSQLTNMILDLGSMCHMKPQVYNLIPGSLEDTYKYIEVADGNYITVNQKLQVKIKCTTIMEILYSRNCTV